MGKSVNKVILLGLVGKDPEVKVLANGTVIANLSLATSERYKDKAGEWAEKTEWHNLVAFARTAEVIRDYVKKGNKLYVEGKLQTSSWDDKETSKKVYRTEVSVFDVTLLTSKGESENGSSNGASNDSAPAPAAARSATASAAVHEPADLSDIPF
jgi:single-strand DNA-binding protein